MTQNKFTKVCPCIVWFPSKPLTKIQKWMNTLSAFSLFGWVFLFYGENTNMNSQVLRIHFLQNSVWKIEIVWDHKSDTADHTTARNKFTKVCPVHTLWSMYCVIPIKTFDQNSKMNEHTFGFFFVWVSFLVLWREYKYEFTSSPHSFSSKFSLKNRNSLRSQKWYRRSHNGPEQIHQSMSSPYTMVHVLCDSHQNVWPKFKNEWTHFWLFLCLGEL